ncbi:hypothetical protein LAZ67_13001142 [Cordylochernes scorpioides]|uniref:Uncharacterized protein n=1 Tax=Cordylochernes scorpioides TaxID=51811 RepID=A0ABY6L3J9_9ARAC|nr:hypothetical protein LAZ67_13001142 [Cordylochernes scorpioides]
MNIAIEMLDSVRDDPNLLQRVITGDKECVYGYDVETKAQSSQWKLPHEPRPKKARQVRSNVKVLLTVFFDCRGLVHHEFLPQGRTTLNLLRFAIWDPHKCGRSRAGATPAMRLFAVIFVVASVAWAKEDEAMEAAESVHHGYGGQGGYGGGRGGYGRGGAVSYGSRGHGSYGDAGYAARGHGGYDHGSYGDHGSYADRAHSAHGAHKRGGYRDLDAYGASRGAHDRYSSKGAYAHDRGAGYEKAYAYDKKAGYHKAGGDKGYYDSHHGLHDKKGYLDQGAYGRYGHDRHGSHDKSGKYGHGNYGYDQSGHHKHGNNYGASAYQGGHGGAVYGGGHYL